MARSEDRVAKAGFGFAFRNSYLVTRRSGQGDIDVGAFGRFRSGDVVFLASRRLPDHAGGNELIKKATGCRILGPAGEAEKIPGIDQPLSGGDKARLGDMEVVIVDVPGHTLGHIAYHIPEARTAFVGDALFALGCGRVFEGDAKMMWASLSRLKSLPAETVIYCAHEYTQANARFALSVDPSNPALVSYAQEVEMKRQRGDWTVPTVLSRELEANPFLRADDKELQAAMGHVGDPVATFAEIRARKDSF